jgi:hypothetical protein
MIRPDCAKARAQGRTRRQTIDAVNWRRPADGSRRWRQLAAAIPALAARAVLPDQANPLGPRLAAFIASRGDWAFTIHSGPLVCATLERLRSGEQARQLVADTARAVAPIGR